MKIASTNISDVKIIEPDVYEDSRGCFFETFNQSRLAVELGLKNYFPQDNESQSKLGTVRGLHLQLPPYTQGKLVRVVSGEILDIAVDLRRNSHTFGKYVAVTLSSDNKRQLWIPEGFAHGFQALSELAIVNYKVTKFYQPDSEVTITPLDPQINIDWPKKYGMTMSEKDKSGQTMSEFLASL